MCWSLEVQRIEYVAKSRRGLVLGISWRTYTKEPKYGTECLSLLRNLYCFYRCTKQAAENVLCKHKSLPFDSACALHVLNLFSIALIKVSLFVHFRSFAVVSCAAWKSTFVVLVSLLCTLHASLFSLVPCAGSLRMSCRSNTR